MSEPTLDALRGVARLTIDGEERELRYPIRSIKRLLDHLGLEGIEALPAALRQVDLETMAPFIWAGLLWREPALTIDQVEGMQFGYLPAVDAVVRAISLSYWGPDDPSDQREAEEGADEPEDPRQPTGAGAGAELSGSAPAGSA